MLGRLLPDVFEPRADALLDFVLADLMEADLTRWVGGVEGVSSGEMAC
jgi:hypothetical protein